MLTEEGIATVPMVAVELVAAMGGGAIVADAARVIVGGEELDTDVAIRNANGLLLDFHEAYGAYAYFGEEVSFRRWIGLNVEFGVGFQGRYP